MICESDGHSGFPAFFRSNRLFGEVIKGAEDQLAAAQLEFYEGTGFIAFGCFVELGSVRQKSGKAIIAGGP
jgi:predicted NUDIX family NTP pyrophosphohydrolase